jgi:hypothetical protein
MTQVRSTKSAGDIRGKKNTTGAALLKGTSVKLHTAKDEVALPAADTDHIYGVVLNDIPDDGWGDIQIRGKALCLTAGALATNGVRLKSDTAGKVVAWSATAGNNAHVVGTLETIAGAADELVEVELAGPGTIAQG